MRENGIEYPCESPTARLQSLRDGTVLQPLPGARMGRACTFSGVETGLPLRGPSHRPLGRPCDFPICAAKKVRRERGGLQYPALAALDDTVDTFSIICVNFKVLPVGSEGGKMVGTNDSMSRPR